MKLTTLWPQIQFYVVGTMGAALIALSVLTYVQGVQKHDLQSQLNSKGIELSVSNASVADLTTSLTNVKKSLQEVERINKEKQAGIADKLKEVEASDKKLIDLEAELKSRPTTLKCAIPKDLADAWKTIK